MVTSHRSIAVLIDTSDSWGRNVVEAIARYAHTARWSFVISPRDGDGRLRIPPQWSGDGVIAMIRDERMAKHLKKRNTPVVGVDVLVQNADWVGQVATDDTARVAMAFEHFRSKNFRHFAYYAPKVNRYPDHRSKLFQQTVEAAGFACTGFDQVCGNDFGWFANPQEVAAWIRQSPTPLAVFAPDPVPARQLTEICQLEGIQIPDEVGVLAGDTDDLLCSIAFPPITSIELDCFNIGQQACVLLAAMMDGDPPPEQAVLIPPLRVIPRHSTEILAISDPDVVEVLRFIRSKACEGLRVSDVLQVIPISRRNLEQKFRAILGRSIAEEIRRTRIDQARKLLIESDLPTAVIAHLCGFSSSVELAHAFRKYEGIKPSDLRARC